MDAGERMDRFELDPIAAPSGFSSLVKAGLGLGFSSSYFCCISTEMKSKKKTPKQLQQLQESRTVNRACIHIKTRGRTLVSSQRCLTDAGFCQDYYFNHSVAGWAYGQSQLARVPGWPSSVAPVLSSAEQMALRWSTPLGVG